MAEDQETKINNLAEALLQRDTLLCQYSLWLESSEEHTKYKGENVIHMLTGAMQALSDVDFIPGVGHQNFIEVISRVQEKTGLDLGVCKKLKYHPDKTSECGADPTGRSLVGSLSMCIPPERSNCEMYKF